jgi:hypothetical protein
MVDVHGSGDPVKTLTPRRQREAGGRCRPYPYIGSTPRCPGTPAGPHWPTRNTTPEPYRGWLGPLVDHQHSGLQGVGAEPVQGFLEGVNPNFALQSVIAAVHYGVDGAFRGAAIKREP